MDIVFYHDPDCGTSRNVVRIVDSAGYIPTIVEYLRVGWTWESESPRLPPRRKTWFRPEKAAAYIGVSAVRAPDVPDNGEREVGLARRVRELVWPPMSTCEPEGLQRSRFALGGRNAGRRERRHRPPAEGDLRLVDAQGGGALHRQGGQKSPRKKRNAPPAQRTNGEQKLPAR